jgi:hypothetical protein
VRNLYLQDDFLFGTVKGNRLAFDPQALWKVLEFRPNFQPFMKIKQLRIGTYMSVAKSVVFRMSDFLPKFVQSVKIVYQQDNAIEPYIRAAMTRMANDFPQLERASLVAQKSNLNNSCWTAYPEVKGFLTLRSLQTLELANSSDIGDEWIAPRDVLIIGRLCRMTSLRIHVGNGFKESVRLFEQDLFPHLQRLHLRVSDLSDATEFITKITDPRLQDLELSFENDCNIQDVEVLTNKMVEKIDPEKLKRFSLTHKNIRYYHDIYFQETPPEREEATFACLRPLLNFIHLEDLEIKFDHDLSFIDQSVLNAISASLPDLHSLKLLGAEEVINATCTDVIVFINRLPLLEYIGMRFTIDLLSGEEPLPSLRQLRVLDVGCAPIIDVDCTLYFIVHVFPKLKSIEYSFQRKSKYSAMWSAAIRLFDSQHYSD